MNQSQRKWHCYSSQHTQQKTDKQHYEGTLVMYVGSSFLSVSIFVEDESQVKNVNRELFEM